MNTRYIIYAFIVLSLSSCHNKDHSMITEVHELKKQPVDIFLNESYSLFLSHFPQAALSYDLNESISYDGLDSYDIGEMETLYSLVSEIKGILSSFNREILSEHEEIQLNTFEYYIDSWIESWDYRYHHYYFTPYYSKNQILKLVDFFVNVCSVESISDAEQYVTRLQNFKKQIKDLGKIIDIQESMSIFLPKSIINKTLRINQQFMISDIDQNIIFNSFESKLQSLDIDDDTARKLLDDVKNELVSSIYPSIELINRKLLNQKKYGYIDGVSHLPDGEHFYRFLLNSSLGVKDAAIEEIFEQSIIDMENVKREILNGFGIINYDTENSLRSLFKSLNNFKYYSSDDRPVVNSEDVIDELDKISRLLFDEFPNETVEVELGSDNYYIPIYSSRAEGPVFSYDPVTPHYLLKTLTAHETFPGHHFQIQLHTEMGFPQFLLYETTTGYHEGWAAYAEYLVDEFGLYENDPYGRLGYLQTKALYIAAFIVDFGLHLMNWTQEDAIQFYISNTGIDRKSAENYVMNHISDPVSRTLYYLGFREFLHLLDKERDNKGRDFNFKEYHKKLLKNGPLPFSLLEANVFNDIR